MALKGDPKSGDWYSEVRTIVSEFETNISDKNIKKMPEHLFKRIVKKGT